MKTTIKFSKYDIVAICSFLVYGTIWSVISLMRFYSLHAYVYDLGYKMQLGWYSLYHPHFGLVTDISHLIVYFSFPLFLLRSEPLLLIFQSFFIGVAAIPIYLITKLKTDNSKLSIFVGLIYLLFPLDIGLNWYDFHFMMFFPTIFLFAYLLFLRKNYKLSIFLFILSGLATYPFLGFSLIFGIVFLLGSLIHVKYKEEKFHFGTEGKYLTVLIILSFAILFIQFHVLNISPSMLSKNPNTAVNIFGNLKVKIITILFIIIISGFSIILKPKWLIFLIPYFFILFYSNKAVFEYPEIMMFQYAPLVTPFVFLALSDTLSKYADKKNHVNLSKKISLKHIGTNVSVKTLIAFLLIIVIVSTLFYNPASPLNKDSPINFNFYNKDIPNLTAYNDLEGLLSLVPSNTPYLMVQQNMPQAYPRAFYPNVGILSVWGGGIAYNSSTNNFWVYSTVKGWEPADIKYVLYDPYSQWAQINGMAVSARLPLKNSSYQNMYNMVYMMLASGKYGILGEAGGMILLERGYSGSLKYYKPEVDSFTISDNAISNSFPDMWHNLNYTFISPGTYQVRLQYAMNKGYRGDMTLLISANSGKTILLQENRYVNVTSGTIFTLEFNLTEYYPNLYVGFTFPNNSNYFTLESLVVKQTAPPSNKLYFGE